MIVALLTLRVMTFNAAGIPVIHARWAARRAALGRALASSSEDIVALQEVWGASDKRVLVAASGRPYSASSPSGWRAGDGLLLLSRFPIIETRRLVFGCAPPFLSQLRHGESIASKGALMARMRAPAGEIDVYNTHLVSDYPGADYSPWRRSQIFELSEMVERFSQDRSFLILADLNIGPGQEDYKLLKDLLGLEDACRASGREACGPSYPTEGVRVDHVLLPAGPKAAVRSAGLALDAPIPGDGIMYSDHAAVAAEVGPAAFARRSRPDPERRVAALRAIRSSLRALQKELGGSAARDWIPVYGFIQGRAAEPHRLRLEAIANRVDTSLIALTGAGTWARLERHARGIRGQGGVRSPAGQGLP